jgi:hypothetical protein
MSRFKSEVPRHLEQYDNEQFCYIPTGGLESGLDPSIYGDAAIPPAYVTKKWGNLSEVLAFVDNENVFWQAFVVLRRS